MHPWHSSMPSSEGSLKTLCPAAKGSAQPAHFASPGLDAEVPPSLARSCRRSSDSEPAVFDLERDARRPVTLDDFRVGGEGGDNDERRLVVGGDDDSACAPLVWEGCRGGDDEAPLPLALLLLREPAVAKMMCTPLGAPPILMPLSMPANKPSKSANGSRPPKNRSNTENAAKSPPNPPTWVSFLSKLKLKPLLRSSWPPWS
mmetsp:Transcript_28781/g.82390  ORF Transcript_28781/g.82390 Transcript_28781/m.82390 type:complete len:202 (-) Transcript_28781:297-902(-)